MQQRKRRRKEGKIPLYKNDEYQGYSVSDWEQFQGYDVSGDDIQAMLRNLIGQQRMIRATLVDEDNRTRSMITQTAEEIRQEVVDYNEGMESLISQTAESIRLEVSDLDGDLRGLISLTAEEIRSEVSDMESGIYSTISQTADTIRSEVSDMESGIYSTISQTADTIRSEVSDMESELQSSITQNATAIQSRVTSSEFESTVTQLNNAIQSRVTNNTFSTTITQLWDELDFKVEKSDYTGDNIISRINLSSTSATIQARRINLVGAVSVLSDLSGNLGTITAGEIRGVNIVGGSITSNTDIDVTSDVRVGNNVYVGQRGTGYIRFPGGVISGKVSGAGEEIRISASDFNGFDITGIFDVRNADMMASQYYANAGGSAYFKYDDKNYLRVSNGRAQLYLNGSVVESWG